MNKLLEIWKSWSVNGVHLPFVFDATTEKPSITLGLLYLTSVVMLTSVIMLHFVDGILTATMTSILVWILAYMFYRLRSIDKASFSLKDQSISLEDTPDEIKTDLDGQKDK